MSTFLIVFFSIYGAVHLYALLKARAAFRLGLKPLAPLTLLLLLMVAAPAIVRISERAGHDGLAKLMAYPGYTWMGLIFLFFSFALALDIYRLVLAAFRKFLGIDPPLPRPSHYTAFIIPLILALLFAGYGYFEALQIRTNEIRIGSSAIPVELDGLRIAQISDVHLGLLIGKDRLTRILTAVQKANPDILVSTGDLVDGQQNNLAGLTEIFRKITPRLGKFAITGNHEFYAGIENALDFTQKAGFTVLRNEAFTVARGLHLVGVDDRTSLYFNQSTPISEKELLTRLPRDEFKILLKHRPQVDRDSLGLFTLQLSGHTHNGQIFPFILLSKILFPLEHGKILRVGQDSLAYVSPGTGTWGPPIRFLAPPEVTIIELSHKTQGED